MLNQASDGLTHQNPDSAHAFWCSLLMCSGSSGETHRTQPPKCYGLHFGEGIVSKENKLRPLYISPIGRGGVDLGIQNILNAVRGRGLITAELLRLPEIYNFAPFLIQHGLPPSWHRGFDIIQGRSRVGFALHVSGKPLVTTVHHLTIDPNLRPYSSLLQRLFYQLIERRFDEQSIREADAVVCVSRYVQRQVAYLYNFHKTIYIPDGIDTQFFTPLRDFARREDGLPLTSARIRLLFIGSNTRRKGFDLLPAIMNLLPDDYVLYYNSGFQRAGKPSPHERMFPIGGLTRAALVAAYQSCDIVLFPSRLEGFGIVPAEALACGRPVVTTDTASLPEIVDHNRNGFLCRRDDIRSYADAVQTLGENALLRKQFGQDGREKVVQLFSYDQLAAGFVKLYSQLLGQT